MESTAMNRPQSMKTFFVIWIGQLISLVGSGLTSFALGIWIYQETGQATPFALTALFGTLPRVLLAPVAGVIADRYDRRRIMLLADSGDALVTGVAALLLFSGQLAVWHIYLIAIASSTFSAFQQPAYSASVTMLVPKEQLARAGGLLQMGHSLEALLTPVISGALFALIGIKGIITIDLISYAFALGALLLVRIPQPPRSQESEAESKQPMLKQAGFGWKYLRQRPGLFWMLWYFASMNFFLNLAAILSLPLVLSFAGPAQAGLVGSIGGAAALAGSLVMSAWGGPKERRVPPMIIFIALCGLGFLFTGLQESLFFVSLGRGWMMFFIPLASALSQAVFQTKVAPDVQGRVFSIRMMISQSIMPLAFLLAGPLADQVFGPLMQPGGVLANSFLGDWLGTGDGRGIALIYVICFACIALFSLAAYASPRIREVEAELPDAIPDDEPAPTQVAAHGHPAPAAAD